MKRFILLAVVILSALPALAAGPFLLTSTQVKHKGTLTEAQVYDGFGCSGRNLSPALAWRNAPPGTKSFAVMVFDPDAPTGSGWWHWVMFNIPATVMSLAAGAGDPAAGTAPAGAVQSRTDFGKPGYGGPCPPRGDRPHRYIFSVHALRVEKLDADENASAAMVGYLVNMNQLAKASIQATYGRK